MTCVHETKLTESTCQWPTMKSYLKQWDTQHSACCRTETSRIGSDYNLKCHVQVGFYQGYRLNDKKGKHYKSVIVAHCKLRSLPLHSRQ